MAKVQNILPYLLLNKERLAAKKQDARSGYEGGKVHTLDHRQFTQSRWQQRRQHLQFLWSEGA